jgi:hypothetical protein
LGKFETDRKKTSRKSGEQKDKITENWGKQAEMPR